MARDPIILHTQRLQDAGFAPAQLAEIEDQVASEVADAVAFAKASAVPEPTELFEDLWATPLETAP